MKVNLLHSAKSLSSGEGFRERSKLRNISINYFHYLGFSTTKRVADYTHNSTCSQILALQLKIRHIKPYENIASSDRLTRLLIFEIKQAADKICFKSPTWGEV